MQRFKRVFASKKSIAAIVLVLALVLIGTASLLKAEKTAEKESTAKGYLGVMLENMSQDDKKEAGVAFGVLVSKVVKGEAAEKAGIKKYDIIQYFNDEKIRRTDDLTEAVQDSKPGNKVKIKLVRDGKEHEFTVILGTLELKALKPVPFNFPGGKGEKNGFTYFMGGGGYLGVNLYEMSKDLSEYFGVKENEGALILSVEKESPAQKAGLKAGDVIVKIDGKDISSPNDVIKIISKMEKGEKVDIDVIRHNKKMTVKAELDARQGFNFIKGFEGSMPEFMPMPGIPEDPQVPCVQFGMPGMGDNHVIIMKRDFQRTEEQMKKAQEQMEKAREKMQKEKEKLQQKYEKKIVIDGNAYI